MLVTQLCPAPCDPWTIAHQPPLFTEFSRQEYWSGLPFPSPGDLPDPGIEAGSPALQANSLPSEPPGKPPIQNKKFFFFFLKREWEERSVSNMDWLSVKNPEQQKSFPLIKLFCTSQTVKHSVLWSGPSICGNSQRVPVLAWSTLSMLCRRRNKRHREKEMRVL